LPAKTEQCIFISTGHVPVIEIASQHDGNILSPSRCCNVRGAVESSVLNLQMNGVLSMFVIIFRAGGFFRFFGIPPVHFSDRFTPADISLGKGWEFVGQLIRDAATFEERVQLAEQYLLRQYKPSAFSAIDTVIQQTLAAEPIPVHEMSRRSYLSERQFRRKFIERTGLSPQTFSRICRSNQALQMKQLNPKKSWRSIAFEKGYTDQSHFRKEMKTLMGMEHTAKQLDKEFMNIEGTHFKLLDAEY
jgi:AraC-like DNA-binding protein